MSACETAPPKDPLKFIRVALLCGVWICVSSILIRFNKYLMEAHRFPFPMALSTLHMGCSLLCSSLLYVVRPSAFPGMEFTLRKRRELFKWFAPIGFTSAVALFASNQAYIYANVTFLQFMKETNVIIIFTISCASGLQQMNRVRVATVLWIVAFSSICVEGELHFVWIGFATQLVSQVAECSRVVLCECVFVGSGLKLDPLTYVMFAAPSCLVFLFLGNALVWDHSVVPRAFQLWHLLLPSALMAFLLNVLMAALIKETSAVDAMVAGVVKDITLVVVSAAAFGEVVTRQQAAGFPLVLLGVLFWSGQKAMPDSSVVRWVEGKMGLHSAADEKLPLIGKMSAK